MSAVDDLFRNLRASRRKAFMPFVTAGDPDLDFTADVIRVLAEAGCQLCEVGIPYSDPIADGPVIQASYTRALERGIKLSQIQEMIAGVAPQLEMPLVSMVSYAIIHRRGPERYVAEAKAGGLAGTIVPDLLVEESQAFADLCRREDFSLIQLVTPTTPRDRAVRIADTSTGFLYYVSVTGITGERTELPAELVESVGWLREQTDLPVCIGFGVSGPDQARRLADVADGVIVGSALVRRIARRTEGAARADVLDDVGQFARSILAAIA